MTETEICAMIGTTELRINWVHNELTDGHKIENWVQNEMMNGHRIENCVHNELTDGHKSWNTFGTEIGFRTR